MDCQNITSRARQPKKNEKKRRIEGLKECAAMVKEEASL
jgi:hypothetical protein